MDVNSLIWAKLADDGEWFKAEILEIKPIVSKLNFRGKGEYKSPYKLFTLQLQNDEFLKCDTDVVHVSSCLEDGSHDEYVHVKLRNSIDDTPGIIDVEDLTYLTYLHEPSILHCIKSRYDHGRIYTNSGAILIAVNPFRPLQVFGEKIILKYKTAAEMQVIHQLPPHVYAIADNAYRAMISTSELSSGCQYRSGNQSILVSGESGAGKTATTKFIMQYLAVITRNVDTSHEFAMVSIEKQVLQSNPILESFGNARTLRNDNSSRFGKFIKMTFAPRQNLSYKIIGGAINTYLLEKVRLVRQGQGERNFHCFYEMVKGASALERIRWGLTALEDYRYTNQSGEMCRRDGVIDEDQYQETRAAMSDMDFSKQQQGHIFDVVAALLHLGNITFECDHGVGEEEEGSMITRTCEFHLALCSKLLGLKEQDLELVLCLKRIKTKLETYYKRQTVSEAEYARDALAKTIYGALFDWVAGKVNRTITSDSDVEARLQSTTFIGVLDIFGFESFKNNSFEQLCINYTNERLQQHFNQFVFKYEQDLYQREGIKWDFIAFPDNQGVLDLLENRRNGLFAICDDQVLFPKATDLTLVNKLYSELGSGTAAFIAGSAEKAANLFVIKHFAGPVTYSSAGFLEKNHDMVRADMAQLLLSASTPLVAQLVDYVRMDDSDAATASSPRQQLASKRLSRSAKVYTLSGLFRKQLEELMASINSTSPHYIRCLKPNSQNAPSAFDCDLVASQMRYGGILETIRVTKAGYPFRISLATFVSSFGFLASLRLKDGTEFSVANELCSFLADLALTNPKFTGEVDSQGNNEKTFRAGIQCGKSMVLMRSATIEFLDKERTHALKAHCTAIQTCCRRYICSTRFNKLRTSCNVAQRAYRCYRARCLRGFLRQTRAVMPIQRVWRGSLARRRVQRAWLGLLMLQAVVRGQQERIRVRELLRNTKASRIAAFIRGYLFVFQFPNLNSNRFHRSKQRRIFLKLRSAAITIQCSYRMHCSRVEAARLRCALKTLQAVIDDRDALRRTVFRLTHELVQAQSLSVRLANLEKELQQCQIELFKEKVRTMELSVEISHSSLRSPGHPKTPTSSKTAKSLEVVDKVDSTKSILLSSSIALPPPMPLYNDTITSSTQCNLRIPSSSIATQTQDNAEHYLALETQFVCSVSTQTESKLLNLGDTLGSYKYDVDLSSVSKGIGLYEEWDRIVEGHVKQSAGYSDIYEAPSDFGLSRANEEYFEKKTSESESFRVDALHPIALSETRSVVVKEPLEITIAVTKCDDIDVGVSDDSIAEDCGIEDLKADEVDSITEISELADTDVGGASCGHAEDDDDSGTSSNYSVSLAESNSSQKLYVNGKISSLLSNIPFELSTVSNVGGDLTDDFPPPAPITYSQITIVDKMGNNPEEIAAENIFVDVGNSKSKCLNDADQKALEEMRREVEELENIQHELALYFGESGLSIPDSCTQFAKKEIEVDIRFGSVETQSHNPLSDGVETQHEQSHTDIGLANVGLQYNEIESSFVADDCNHVANAPASLALKPTYRAAVLSTSSNEKAAVATADNLNPDASCEASIVSMSAIDKLASFFSALGGSLEVLDLQSDEIHSCVNDNPIGGVEDLTVRSHVSYDTKSNALERLSATGFIEKGNLREDSPMSGTSKSSEESSWMYNCDGEISELTEAYDAALSSHTAASQSYAENTIESALKKSLNIISHDNNTNKLDSDVTELHNGGISHNKENDSQRIHPTVGDGHYAFPMSLCDPHESHLCNTCHGSESSNDLLLSPIINVMTPVEPRNTDEESGNCAQDLSPHPHELQDEEVVMGAEVASPRAGPTTAAVSNESLEDSFDDESNQMFCLSGTWRPVSSQIRHSKGDISGSNAEDVESTVLCLNHVLHCLFSNSLEPDDVFHIRQSSAWNDDDEEFMHFSIISLGTGITKYSSAYAVGRMNLNPIVISTEIYSLSYFTSIDLLLRECKIQIIGPNRGEKSVWLCKCDNLGSTLQMEINVVNGTEYSIVLSKTFQRLEDEIPPYPLSFARCREVCNWSSDDAHSAAILKGLKIIVQDVDEEVHLQPYSYDDEDFSSAAVPKVMVYKIGISMKNRYWTVKHTYEEFSSLNDCVVIETDGCVYEALLPAFPSQWAGSGDEREKFRQLMKPLQIYLGSLTALGGLEISNLVDALSTFLEIPEHIAGDSAKASIFASHPASDGKPESEVPLVSTSSVRSSTADTKDAGSNASTHSAGTIAAGSELDQAPLASKSTTEVDGSVISSPFRALCTTGVTMTQICMNHDSSSSSSSSSVQIIGVLSYDIETSQLTWKCASDVHETDDDPTRLFISTPLASIHNLYRGSSLSKKIFIELSYRTYILQYSDSLKYFEGIYDELSKRWQALHSKTKR